MELVYFKKSKNFSHNIDFSQFSFTFTSSKIGTINFSFNNSANFYLL